MQSLSPFFFFIHSSSLIATPLDHRHRRLANCCHARSSSTIEPHPSSSFPLSSPPLILRSGSNSRRCSFLSFSSQVCILSHPFRLLSPLYLLSLLFFFFFSIFLSPYRKPSPFSSLLRFWFQMIESWSLRSWRICWRDAWKIEECVFGFECRIWSIFFFICYWGLT